MLRIDGRVLAASVLGIFIIGAAVGFAVGGTGGQSTGPADGPTATPVPTDSPVPTATSTPGSNGSPTQTGTTGAGTATRSPTVTPTATATPTKVPTSTPAPTATLTPDPTPTPTRAPMLIRRFDVAEIERHLRRLVNDWREDEGLDPFKESDGHLVTDLDRMATGHSVDMADLGETVHRIDNTSSAGRYRQSDLFETCKFKKNGSQYIVTPTRNRLEVLGTTYAGRAYETPEGTRYNENEREVAQALFDGWTESSVFRDRLSYTNASRIGIGIETTEDNEVYVTGNLCGSPGSS